MVEPSQPNTKRYLPPIRTSVSQESNVIGNDFGAHHRSSNSGLVHAANTMRRAADGSRYDELTLGLEFHRRGSFLRGCPGPRAWYRPNEDATVDRSYCCSWRRTTSVIQVGANGDVQFGGVG